MVKDAASLPEDPAELRATAADLIELVKSQALQIETLKHALAGHRRHRFGTKSETLEQLELSLEEAEIGVASTEDAAPTGETSRPKKRPKRKPLPDSLPRNEQVLSPGDACGQCGGALKGVGEDVTEELDDIPGRFVVTRIVRPRMACRCCEAFCQAPLPSRPIERGRPGPGLLAHVLVSKYGDHLPLYRQSRIFGREGIDLDRSTLADWVGSSAKLLEPLADAIGRHVCGGPAIFADGEGRRPPPVRGPARTRSRCRLPATGAPRPPEYGPMCATSAPGSAPRRQRPGTASRSTGRAHIPRII